MDSPPRAIGHALTSAFAFSVMGVFVKLATNVGVLERVVVRNLVTLAITFVVVLRGSRPLLGERRNRPYLLARSLLGIGGVVCYFFAIDHLLLADAAMLAKLSPFFVTVFAAIFLGERFDGRLGVALLLGFVGGTLVIKPKLDLEAIPALVGTAAAVFASGAYVLLRFLREREKPETIVFFFSLVTVVGLAPVVLPSFKPPTIDQWLWLIGLGASAAIGQLALTAAYRHAPAGRVSLIGYATIVFSALFGWLVWSEVPDALSLAGGLLILAGAVVAFARRSTTSGDCRPESGFDGESDGLRHDDRGSEGAIVTTRGIPRNLIIGTVVATAVSAILITAGAVAFHTYGNRRLDDAQTAFRVRWGHLEPPSPRVPLTDPDNGARWLELGGQAISVTLEDQRFYTQLMARSRTAWSTAESTQARRILDEQREALAQLLETGSNDGFRLASDNAGTAASETDYLDLVKGIRLLVLEARLAWGDGRSTDCLAALNALGRIADGLLRTPTLLSLTLGAATDRWTAGAAADIVSNPCADVETLRTLRNLLPSEDPIERANITLATSVAEISEEGLLYIENVHDPSMGWSVPFWVSNRFLFENLVVARTLEAWSRYLELGQVPVAQWPVGIDEKLWAGTEWPPWIALAGHFTPNLLPAWVRVQAAATQLEQLRYAIALRLASPGGLEANACELGGAAPLAALTGTPIVCRFDATLNAIVVEVTGAEEALERQFSSGSPPAMFPGIALPVDRIEECR